MMNEAHGQQCVKCFSFKGVIVGAIVAFGLIFLFNLLTIGGGLSAYTKTQGGLEALVFLSYLWVVVGSFLMLFIAGLVTTWVTHHGEMLDHRHSVLQGFTTWALYLLISLAFLSQATETTVILTPKSFLSMAQGSQSGIKEDLAGVGASMSSEQRNTHRPTSPGAQKTAHKIGLATLGAFFVFFVEAIGCCFGAWCAMELNRNKKINS